MHPQSPAYDAGAFLLSHASKIWRPRSDSHRHVTLLQSVALLFGDSAVAERTGLEPACPGGRHVSTVVAYRLAYLSVLASSEIEMAEAGGLAPPRRCRRLASNEGGLLLPNASKFSGSPSETRTRICSLKDCRPALSRWGRDVVPRVGVEPTLPDRESGVLSR